MEERSICLGVDVGNFDTKTPLTTTPSGYETQMTAPFGADECLEYNGRYYIPDDQNRFKYVENKTTDDHSFILTLIGISKEIIEMGKHENIPPDHMQDYISSINTIHLGVGLPPAHMPLYKEKLHDYYQMHFGWNGIHYKFNGYSFNLSLGLCGVYPQDYAAIKNYERTTEEPLFGGIPDYYAVDIGGYTVDVVPVIDGKAQGSKSVSFELGVLRLYDQISADLRRSYGKSYDHKIIETYLSGKPTMLSEAIKTRIEELCLDWTNSIINNIRQSGVLFDAYPVVFIGGGSQRLRKYIEANDVITMKEFIPDASANAEGYEYLINVQVQQAGWSEE